MSVEPSKGNYNIMRQNTRIFRNVIPVHAALWNKVTMLAMTEGQRTPNALEWGFMVQPKEEVRLSPSKGNDHLQFYVEIGWYDTHENKKMINLVSSVEFKSHDTHEYKKMKQLLSVYAIALY